jgi:hypothetical protein
MGAACIRLGAVRWLVFFAAGTSWLSCSNVSGSLPNGSSGACGSNVGEGGAEDGAAGMDGAGDDGAANEGGAGACQPGDSDGVVGGCYVFEVTVDDTGFSPIILKAQNRSAVALTMTNAGSRPHDFVLGCLPTPNANGCPLESCFPAGANLAAVPPGGSATAMFVTPNPEGIYNFRSDVGPDSELLDDGGVNGLWGQFVVQ